MRTLPDNICAHPDGFLVRVQRNKVLFQAFINKARPNALERAIELRDRFLANAGRKVHAVVCRPQTCGRSNTGVSGISETVQFNGTRAYPCFNVSWSERGKGHCKRFHFGKTIGRDQAFGMAIAFRREKIANQKTEVAYV